jgi:hypothetical protein
MSDVSDEAGTAANAGIPPSAREADDGRSGHRGGDESAGTHSPLLGFMSVPVHRRLPIRRSTLLMAVAFVGFGTLLYFNPATSTPAGSGQVVHTPNGDYLVPGAIKLPPSTTTTVPSTTTTTRPAAAPTGSSTTAIRPATGSTPTATQPAVVTTTTTSTIANATTITRGSSGPTTTTTTTASPVGSGGAGDGATTTTSAP